MPPVHNMKPRFTFSYSVGVRGPLRIWSPRLAWKGYDHSTHKNSLPRSYEMQKGRSHARGPAFLLAWHNGAHRQGHPHACQPL